MSFSFVNLFSKEKLVISATLTYLFFLNRRTLITIDYLLDVCNYFLYSIPVNITQYDSLCLPQGRIFQNAFYIGHSMLFKHIHIIFQLPLMSLFNLVRSLNFLNHFILRIIIIHLDTIYFNLFIFGGTQWITFLVNEFPIIHKI